MTPPDGKPPLLLREGDPRFANLERKVGGFVLATLLILAGVGVLAGVRQGAFRPKGTVSFLDESGRDLSEGMAVFTRGFRIGKVAKLRLTEAGKVEARLALDKAYLKWVKADSMAYLRSKIIGDSWIELSPGTPGSPPLDDGATIGFRRDKELTEVAQKVMEEEVKPVLLAVSSLIRYLDDPQGDVKSTIAHLNTLSAGLVETRARLDRTIVDVGEKVGALAANLESLSASLRQETLPKIDTFAAQANQVAGDTDRAVRSIDAYVREDLRGVTAALRKDIDGVAASLQDEVLPALRSLVASTDRAVAGAGQAVGKVDKEIPAILEKVNASLAHIEAITKNLVPASREVPAVVEGAGAAVEEYRAIGQRAGEIWPLSTGTQDDREKRVEADSYRVRAPQSGAGDPAARGR